MELTKKEGKILETFEGAFNKDKGINFLVNKKDFSEEEVDKSIEKLVKEGYLDVLDDMGDDGNEIWLITNYEKISQKELDSLIGRSWT